MVATTSSPQIKKTLQNHSKRVVSNTGRNTSHYVSEGTQIADAQLGSGTDINTIHDHSKDDAVIGGFRKIEHGVNKFWSADLATFAGAGIVGWIARKTGLHGVSNAVNRVRGYFEALHTTPLSRPQEFAKHVTEGYAKVTEKNALRLAAQEVHPKAPFTWDPFKAFRNRSARSEKIQTFVNETKLESLSVNGKAATKAKDTALAAAEKTTKWESSGLAKAGQTLETQAGKAYAPLASNVERGLLNIEKSGAGQSINKMFAKLPKWNWLNAAREGGMTGAAKALANGIKRMPLIGAIAVTGATAAIGANVLSSRKESRAIRTTLDHMKADLGTDSPIVARLEHSLSKYKSRTRLKNTFSTAGEIVNASMMTSMNFGGAGAGIGSALGGVDMKLMVAGIGLPMISQIFVSQVPAINAYEAMRLNEAGEIKLSDTEKLNCLKVFIGDAVIGEKEGGIFNKLAEPVAQAVLDKGLPLRETMRLISNNAQFTALVADASQTQKAAAAVEEAAPAAETAKPASVVEMAYHQAEKPAPIIAMGNHEMHGRVGHQQQHARA